MLFPILEREVDYSDHRTTDDKISASIIISYYLCLIFLVSGRDSANNNGKLTKNVDVSNFILSFETYHYLFRAAFQPFKIRLKSKAIISTFAVIIICSLFSQIFASVRFKCTTDILFMKKKALFVYNCMMDFNKKEMFLESLILRPHKIIFLFPVPARITFDERIKKFFLFYFIQFDVFVTPINNFSVKAEPFCPLFQSKYVSSRFYDLIS